MINSVYFKGKEYNFNDNIVFVYLVYCNVEPIIYAVYSNIDKAIKYAKSLVEFRKAQAISKNYQFTFSHYYDRAEEEKEMISRGEKIPFDNELEIYSDKLIFSTYLSIKGDKSQFSEDGCNIKVVRRRIVD